MEEDCGKEKYKNMEEVAQEDALPILDELGYELVDVEYKKKAHTGILGCISINLVVSLSMIVRRGK